MSDHRVFYPDKGISVHGIAVPVHPLLAVDIRFAIHATPCFRLRSKLTSFRRIPYTAGMDKTLDTAECARILKSLGDESRLKIVQLLLQGECNVSKVVQSLNMAQPQVSHHLAILRGCGLVSTRREGNRIINFIDPEVRSMLKKNELGLDLGCCSITFE
ncbi:ArsR/SmtB family transcription factor [Nitrospina gracilis]|nr:metalloregulator ArsR/SmtB family transcription factor [Nitrospina gracilis]